MMRDKGQGLRLPKAAAIGGNRGVTLFTVARRHLDVAHSWQAFADMDPSVNVRQKCYQ